MNLIEAHHDALIYGGLRWFYITDSAFAYLRESKRESMLVFISRSAGSHTLNLEPLGYKVKETLYGKPAKGNNIKINSQKANCGIWLLK